MSKGIFVVIEGSDGAGKTSVINILKDIYTNRPDSQLNYPTQFLRAPGGCPVGETIREMFLDNNTILDPISEMALMFTNHRENYYQIIKPAIDEGAIVFCDRYIATTFAYQGVGRGMIQQYCDMKSIMVSKEMIPDLTVLVDAPEEIRFKRMMQRGGTDRMEATDIEFKRRVDKGFKQWHNDYTIINDGDTDELKDKCSKLISVIDALVINKA